MRYFIVSYMGTVIASKERCHGSCALKVTDGFLNRKKTTDWICDGEIRLRHVVIQNIIEVTEQDYNDYIKN